MTLDEVTAWHRAREVLRSSVAAALGLPRASTALSCTVYRVPGARPVKVWDSPVDTTVSHPPSTEAPTAPDVPAGLI
ncbi:MAG: hypothetical protein OXF00_10205 [bacterium]|nr:hypothetical protein [bacterium]